MQTFKEHLNEYELFCEAIDKLVDGTLNEGLLPSFISKKIDFVQDLAKTLKINVIEIAKLFKEKIVFKFFSAIKWSFSKLFSILKEGFKAYKSVLSAISEYIASTKVAKWTEDKLKDLDVFLQKHPKLKKIGGIAVSAILVYIWFNMTFTGDFSYDFGMDDMLAALGGEYTLSTLFAGPEGAKLLTLFVTGMLGLSFPWPGPSSIQFIGGVLISLAKKVKVKLNLKIN